MKLTKNIKIKKYRVLADYKVKVKKSPFMAIVQLAAENDGIITSIVLYEELLKPLSHKACKNLLDRLSIMGYFDILDKDDYYSLTKLGYQAIDTGDFYDQRNGLLEIWTTNENEFTQKIIKVKELRYDDDKETKTQNITHDLKLLENPQLTFNLINGSFTIDKISNQIKFFEISTEQLIIKLEDSHSTTKLVDFLQKNNYKKQKAINDILDDEYEELYDYKKRILLVEYNPEQLQFTRNIKIEIPYFKNTPFDEIEIPNIKVSPKSSNDAKKWHLALLKQQINRYFLNDKDFSQFSNSIADKFELYKSDLRNSISRKEFITYLDDRKDFYKKAKLETIDYLNY